MKNELGYLKITLRFEPFTKIDLEQQILIKNWTLVTVFNKHFIHTLIQMK